MKCAVHRRGAGEGCVLERIGHPLVCLCEVRLSVQFTVQNTVQCYEKAGRVVFLNE